MLTATQVAGFIGAGLAGAAYVPQIWHLARVHCSAGISRVAFVVWWTASVLITSHAVATGAAVFIALGVVQIAAITLILVFATRYRSSVCTGHVVVAQTAGTGPVRPAIGGDHVNKAGLKAAKTNMLELIQLQKDRGGLERTKKDYNNG